MKTFAKLVLWMRALTSGLLPSRRCEVDGRILRFRGRTLHEAMTENGIDPGGACRTGRCGRCRVRCVDGGFRLLAPRGWAGGGEILACQVAPASDLRCVRSLGGTGPIASPSPQARSGP